MQSSPGKLNNKSLKGVSRTDAGVAYGLEPGLENENGEDEDEDESSDRNINVYASIRFNHQLVRIFTHIFLNVDFLGSQLQALAYF